MITTETDRDIDALRYALLILEHIAKRSTDQSSRVLAEGAAGALRARVAAHVLDKPEATEGPPYDAATATGMYDHD